MNTKLKELYEAPSTIVLEVKIQGIICQSQTDYNYGNLDNPEGMPSSVMEIF